jgi:hypothetical protein
LKTKLNEGIGSKRVRRRKAKLPTRLHCAQRIQKLASTAALSNGNAFARQCPTPVALGTSALTDPQREFMLFMHSMSIHLYACVQKSLYA